MMSMIRIIRAENIWYNEENTELFQRMEEQIV